MIINANAGYTKSTAATLSLNATDPVGVTGYRISSTATPPLATATGWTAVSSKPSYSGSIGYTLSAGNGT